jgi:hypothetical protein
MSILEANSTCSTKRIQLMMFIINKRIPPRGSYVISMGLAIRSVIVTCHTCHAATYMLQVTSQGLEHVTSLCAQPAREPPYHLIIQQDLGPRPGALYKLDSQPQVWHVKGEESRLIKRFPRSSLRPHQRLQRIPHLHPRHHRYFKSISNSKLI